MGYKGPALILTFTIMYCPDHSNCSALFHAVPLQMHGRCVFPKSKYHSLTPTSLLLPISSIFRRTDTYASTVHFQSIDSCHTVKDKQYFKSTTQLACMNIGGWVRKNPDCTVLWQQSSSLYGSNMVPHNRPSTHFVHMAVSFCMPSEQFCQHDILKNLSGCSLTQPGINYNTKQTSLCCTK
jgi:hypothetical protein